MSELFAFITAHYEFTGMVLAVVTAIVGVISSIVYRVQNPESDYVFGLESEANPRLVFMLVLWAIASILMAKIWIVLAPVAIIGVAVWLAIRLRDWRIVRNARRRWNT